MNIPLFFLAAASLFATVHKGSRKKSQNNNGSSEDVKRNSEKDLELLENDKATKSKRFPEFVFDYERWGAGQESKKDVLVDDDFSIPHQESYSSSYDYKLKEADFFRFPESLFDDIHVNNNDRTSAANEYVEWDGGENLYRAILSKYNPKRIQEYAVLLYGSILSDIEKSTYNHAEALEKLGNKLSSMSQEEFARIIDEALILRPYKKVKDIHVDGWTVRGSFLSNTKLTKYHFSIEFYKKGPTGSRPFILESENPDSHIPEGLGYYLYYYLCGKLLNQ